MGKVRVMAGKVLDIVWNQVQTVREVYDISKEVDMVWNQVQTVRKVYDVSKDRQKG